MLPSSDRADGSRPRAVLFDFSGTLFHIETAEEAVRAALGADFVQHAAELERFGAVNGSGRPDELPEHLIEPWAERDLSMRSHRAAYSGSAVHAGLTEEQAYALYERGVSPDAWSPYPDTAAVLKRLTEADVPVALVSNIGWDPRPVLDRWDVRDRFTALVLSYERGVIKPDTRMFEIACAELGVEPGEALMIGDNPEADGAATAIGCSFVLVAADPARRPPDALLLAVRPALRDPGAFPRK